jgi:hypothetical protein
MLWAVAGIGMDHHPGSSDPFSTMFFDFFTQKIQFILNGILFVLDGKSGFSLVSILVWSLIFLEKPAGRICSLTIPP